MFIAIASTLLLLTLLAEQYIYRQIATTLSTPSRVAYIIISALSLATYPLINIIGRIWEIFSPLWSAIGSVTFIMMMLDAAIKIPYAIGLMAERKWSSKALKQLFVIVSILLAASILYGTFVVRHSVRTKEVTLYFADLPRSADGLRIAQIADIHIGLKPTRERVISRAVELINRAEVDVVIDCGDVINSRHSELDEPIQALLSSLHAPLGIYTVEGNHDMGMYIRDTIALPRHENSRLYHQKLAEMGWQEITGRTVALATGRHDTILLTGLPYPDIKRGRHKGSIEEDYTSHFDGLPTNAFNIVAAHTPATWESILAASDAELTLSGHTHAMQIKLPFGGPRGWSPAALVYDYWGGLYERGGRWLSVSEGVGSSTPLRIGSWPEIIIITLRKQ